MKSKTTAAKPPRKSTSIVRKEEKRILLKQIAQLQLKHQSLQSAQQNKLQYALHREHQRLLCQSAMHLQRHSFANIQSAVSSYVSTQKSLPHENTIHLTADFSQRHMTLATTKQHAIKAGLAFVSARTRYLDPFRPFSEVSRFQLDSGDYCSLQLEHMPLTTRATLREVFDAAVEKHSNLDMRITDAFDDITTCDEIDYRIDGAQQSRFTSHLACGVGVEMNFVVCHEFIDQSDEFGPVGVFTGDFVDHDDLYPYRPTEYIRHDVTGVQVIRSHTRKRLNPLTGCEEEENIVTITQANLFKQRHTEIPMSPGLERTLRQQLGRWGDVILASLVEQTQRR